MAAEPEIESQRSQARAIFGQPLQGNRQAQPRKVLVQRCAARRREPETVNGFR